MAEKIDFDQITAIISSCETDVINTLNSTRPEAQEEFLADDSLPKPDNVLGKLNAEELQLKVDLLSSIESWLNRLEKLHGEGKPSNSGLSDKQQRAIRMAVEASLRNNEFCLACANYRENPNAETAAAQKAANEALYGKPDYNTYQALLKSQLEIISKRELSGGEQIMYHELMELLKDVKLIPAERYQPKPETVETFSALMREYMTPIVANLPSDRKISIEELAALMHETLRDNTDESSEWDAEYQPNRIVANANQHRKKLEMPGKRPKNILTYLEACKLKSHEEGVHAMRGIPYEKTQIEMFRTGMPDYEAFEEGVAKAAEQAYEGKYEDANPERYIAIGLASFEGMNFRQVFEILKRLMSLVDGKDQTKLAFTTTQRAFRGTDDLSNNKDMIYYNGNVKFWKYVEKHLDDPELFDHLFLYGKSDASNPEHERIMYEARVGAL